MERFFILRNMFPFHVYPVKLPLGDVSVTASDILRKPVSQKLFCLRRKVPVVIRKMSSAGS